MQGMSIFVSVVRKTHGETMSLAKTPWGCMDFRIDCATGKWRDELLEIVECTTNRESLVA